MCIRDSTNAYVDNADLEKGFGKAFNRLVGEREKHIERWNSMKLDGTPLEKIRAGQMMEATESGQLQQYVPEAAQLVLEEITIFGAKKYGLCIRKLGNCSDISCK